MDSAQLRRALTRIAHEILERNAGAENLGLVGVRTHGVPLAARIAESIGLIEGGEAPPVGAMDVTLYRDDVGRLGRTANLQPTDIPFDVDGMTIVLVDDVLYTGRTIRSAMDALIDFGRPAAIQLAVAVDRGHRELPIRPDYVGKNVPTARNQKISVRLSELGDRDGVYLEEVSDGS
jgi:pyrimidine operon attenuation protein/uracil phosphoribosyltransferase